MQLICLVNMHGLFFEKTKEELLLLMHFKKQIKKEGNQTKYGLIKVVNFATSF